MSGDTVRFEIRNEKNKRKRFAFFPTAVTEPDEEAVDLVVPDEYHDDRGKLLHVMTRLWETHIQWGQLLRRSSIDSFSFMARPAFY